MSSTEQLIIEKIDRVHDKIDSIKEQSSITKSRLSSIETKVNTYAKIAGTLIMLILSAIVTISISAFSTKEEINSDLPMKKTEKVEKKLPQELEN
jgi:hypothetical protein